MDLTEEDSKKRWQEYTEDLFCIALLCTLGTCFCYVHTVSVLYCAHICMKCSLGISNFHEEISSLSHSNVFLYFFALITEEGYLISPCYSLELCIQMLIFPFLLCFLLLFFSQLFVRPTQTAILLFAFLFHGDGLDPCLLYNVMNVLA